MLQLSMKCSYSAFNAQGLRLIIVVVQLGAVNLSGPGIDLKLKERKKERKKEKKISKH